MFVYLQTALAEKIRGLVTKVVREILPGWTVYVPAYPDPGIDLLFDLQRPQTQLTRRIKVTSAAAALKDEDRIRQEVFAALKATH